MDRTFQGLKARPRAGHDDYPEHLSLCVHRALSLLDRAEQGDDPDSRFILRSTDFRAALAALAEKSILAVSIPLETRSSTVAPPGTAASTATRSAIAWRFWRTWCQS